VRRVLAGMAIVGLLSGCSGGAGEPGGDSTEPQVTPTPTPTAEPLVTSSPTPYAGPTGAPERAAWQLTAQSLGPLELGMTVPDGESNGWVARLPHCDRWGSSPALRQEGIDLVFDDQDRLAEIWLGNSVHATADGARVGMAIEEIAFFHGTDLEFEERDSVGGRLMVPFVRAGEHELVFYAIGNENETPGPRAPVTAIGARAYGKDVVRPSC